MPCRRHWGQRIDRARPQPTGQAGTQCLDGPVKPVAVQRRTGRTVGGPASCLLTHSAPSPTPRRCSATTTATPQGSRPPATRTLRTPGTERSCHNFWPPSSPAPGWRSLSPPACLPACLLAASSLRNRAIYPLTGFPVLVLLRRLETALAEPFPCAVISPGVHVGHLLDQLQ